MTMVTEELQERDLRTTDGGTAIALWTGLSAVLAFAVFVIWAVTGRGTFWPMWVWLGLALPLVAVTAIRGALNAPPGAPRALAVHGTAWGVVVTLCVLLWAMTGRGYFWPAWPMLGAVVALLAHGTIATAAGKLPDERERQLGIASTS